VDLLFFTENTGFFGVEFLPLGLQAGSNCCVSARRQLERKGNGGRRGNGESFAPPAQGQRGRKGNGGRRGSGQSLLRRHGAGGGIYLQRQRNFGQRAWQTGNSPRLGLLRRRGCSMRLLFSYRQAGMPVLLIEARISKPNCQTAFSRRLGRYHRMERERCTRIGPHGLRYSVQYYTSSSQAIFLAGLEHTTQNYLGCQYL
jgi:hypothetical protein